MIQVKTLRSGRFFLCSNIHSYFPEKSCGHPGELANGHYEFPNRVEVGAVITAVCNTGSVFSLHVWWWLCMSGVHLSFWDSSHCIIRLCHPWAFSVRCLNVVGLSSSSFYDVCFTSAATTTKVLVYEGHRCDLLLCTCGGVLYCLNSCMHAGF